MYAIEPAPVSRVYAHPQTDILLRTYARGQSVRLRTRAAHALPAWSMDRHPAAHVRTRAAHALANMAWRGRACGRGCERACVLACVRACVHARARARDLACLCEIERASERSSVQVQCARGCMWVRHTQTRTKHDPCIPPFVADSACSVYLRDLSVVDSTYFLGCVAQQTGMPRT